MAQELRLFGLGMIPIVWVAVSMGQSKPVTFEKDIQPLVKQKCLRCHTGEKSQGGLDLSTIAGWKKGGVSGPVLNLKNPAESLLMVRILGTDGKMKMPMGETMSAADVSKFQTWVDQGAKLPLPEPTFNEVQAIFQAHCSGCHGAESPKAGLNLFTKDGIQRVVKAGKPDESQLMRRVLGLDGKPQMPMGFAPLSAAKLDTLKRWIAAGAKTETKKAGLWSFGPVTKPVPPAVGDGWAVNGIDRFVYAKLKEQGLKPNAPASDETLLRRLYLDLVGLPPTPAEVDVYLADKSADRYERKVDELLKSPHYGERQARIWLDLSRYADTNGFEKDGMRTAWRYRDWVINAFNRNMPFDQFTIEQVAGDMLPKANQDQLIATGFLRNSMQNMEGGVDQAEAYHYVIVDRVNTTSSVFMGATVACARCHDHKFDPISQKDYYGLYALMGNTKYEVTGDNNVGGQLWMEPVLNVIPEATQKELDAVAASEKDLKSEIAQKKPAVLAEYSSAPAVVETPEGAELSVSAPSLTISKSADYFLVQGNANSADYKVTFGNRAANPTLFVHAETDPSLPANGPGTASSGNFILGEVFVEVEGTIYSPVAAASSIIQAGYSISDVSDGNLETGLAAYNGIGKPLVAGFRFEGLPTTGERKLVLRFGSAEWPNHRLGKLRVTSSSQPTALWAALPKKPSEDEILGSHPTLAKQSQKLRALQRKKRALDQQIEDSTALIVREKPTTEPLTAWLLTRGEFLGRKEKVPAAVPAQLPKMKPGERADRLSFAKWLVRKDNPLTGRVFVNRVWHQYFGRGIVETVEDFGTQGSPPTHPELLDWLANEFVTSGWNQKALHRKIVLSRTYRQSSKASPEVLAKDPKNEWLARGPRVRLEAELIRDSVLSASGLLSRKVGGPSVFPSQPAGVWNSPYSGERWIPSQGEDAYRRGIYTFIKRTSPYPNFAAFDAPSREECTVRRSQTNTPLQALAMMNDATVIEAAEALSKRMTREGGADLASRLKYGFRLCTGRRPTAAELNRLVALAKKRKNSLDLAAIALLNLDETITKE